MSNLQEVAMSSSLCISTNIISTTTTPHTVRRGVFYSTLTEQFARCLSPRNVPKEAQTLAKRFQLFSEGKENHFPPSLIKQIRQTTFDYLIQCGRKAHQTTQRSTMSWVGDLSPFLDTVDLSQAKGEYIRHKTPTQHQNYLKALLTEAPHVKHLLLDRCSGIDCHMIDWITLNCPYLETLSLSHCDHVDDPSVCLIVSRLEHLTSLDLSYCSQVSSKSCSSIGKYGNQLEVLNLSGLPLIDDDAVRSALTPALTTLLLDHNPQISDTLFSELHELGLN
jgi:hypothetical protein